METKSTRAKYDFIDGIRCITMLFIVAEHCVATGTDKYSYGTDLYWAFLFMMQIAKFGSVVFFLLSGFLIGDNFSTYSPFQYLKRRISSTVWPWLIWSWLYILVDIARALLLKPLGMHPAFVTYDLFLNLKGLYTYSCYWFVINFMVSISILLMFRTYLYSIYLGVTLGVITLFYSVNIYFNWILPNHTTAILGFVFFLWLGAQLRKHWELINKLRIKTPLWLILTILLITYFLSIYESTLLEGLPGDRTNTLRISNILYSIACFALMLKIRSYKWVNYLEPRQTTYGIYLIHFILVVFLLPIIFPNVQLQYLSVTQLIEHKLLCFLAVYVITFGIVSFLNKTGARILIGN